MARAKGVVTTGTKREMRPSLTPEAEEGQMIALATALVKQRLIDGTASSQETTHFLKLASREYKLKTDILEKEKDLIAAKTEALQSQKRVEELYAEALSAMRSYAGQGDSYE